MLYMVGQLVVVQQNIGGALRGQFSFLKTVQYQLAAVGQGKDGPVVARRNFRPVGDGTAANSFLAGVWAL